MVCKLCLNKDVKKQNKTTKLPCESAIPLLGLHPRELKTYVHTDLDRNAHSSMSQNNKEVEMTQMSIN